MGKVITSDEHWPRWEPRYLASDIDGRVWHGIVMSHDIDSHLRNSEDRDPETIDWSIDTKPCLRRGIPVPATGLYQRKNLARS